MRHLKRFHEFYLDASSLIIYNISIFKKGKVKDLKKNRETNGGQIKEQDVPFT